MKIHESRHSHKSKTTASALATAVVLAAQLAAQAASPELQAQTLSPAFKNFPAALKSKIQYVIVLYPENRSFDSLYGSFPGANGLANAGFGAESQYGKSNSTVLPSLPLPNMNGISLIGNNNADPRFASVFGSTMPNQDVDVSTAVPDVYCHGDLTHLFYLEQYQINNRSYGVGLDPKNAGGPLMSKFTEWSSNPGMVLSHYDEQNGGEGSLAKQYVLGDNCFHSAFGGSFLNHQWLIAARTPVWPGTITDGSGGAPAPGGAAVTPEDPQALNAAINPTGQWWPAATGADLGVGTGHQLADNALTPDPTLPGFPHSSANQTLGAGDYWAVNTLRPLKGPAGGYAVPATAPFMDFPQGITGETTSPSAASPYYTVVPAPVSWTAVNARLPLQYYDTIGDRLNAAPGGAVSWAWFSGGWDDAKNGVADFLFQFHHQPFAFFAKYTLASAPSWGPNGSTTAPTPGSDSLDPNGAPVGYGVGSKNHLLDEDADFYPMLNAGTLPKVSFVKPIGEDNSHPGYASVKRGQSWVANTVAKIKGSSIWPNCVIFVCYDEHGGLYDHVAPPVIDRWGPGLRVPFMVISPWSKKSFVDHNQYETVSMLAFIEQVYNLPPLNTRDANALPPVAAFAGEPDLFLEATHGQPVSYQIQAYNSPIGYAASAALPTGLSLNHLTGQITGTPANIGTSLVIITVTGATPGNNVTYELEIDVN